MDDGSVIQSVLNGNTKDYELLVKKYQQSIFRTAIGFVHVKEDAEEITQDVFVNAYLSLSRFGFQSSFATWLYRIAVNNSINYIRRKKANRIWGNISLFFNVASADKSPEKMLSEKEDQYLLKKAMDTLSEKQRTAFILSKYEGLPQKEVAAILDINEGAVEQLLIRAKSNLKKILEKNKRP